MVVVPYKDDIAQRLQAYFVENVFISGQGPDFREWVKEQGGAIRLTDDRHFVLEFEDDRLYTLFMLKY